MRYNLSLKTISFHRQGRTFSRAMRRAALLASVVLGLASPAFANDATVGGVSEPVGPGFNLSPIAIFVPFPVLPTVVTVDTEDLNGPFNTVYVTGSIAPTTVDVAAGRTLNSTLGGGIVVGSLTGDVAINSAGRITSLLSGIAVGNAGFGFTPITANTAIDGRGAGSIIAGVNGVEAYSVSTTAGRGTITIRNFTGGITGANDGILTNFGTGGTLGDVLITGNGDVTGTLRNGIESYTTGATTITNNGVVTGAINGIASNFGIFTTPAATTIVQTRNATGGATGSGIVAGTGAGNINITSSAVASGGSGIFALSGSTGNVIVDGGNTGRATGSVLDGVVLNTASATAGRGLATVQNFGGGITGLRNGITVNFGTGGTLGDVLITNNGTITGTLRNGIESYTTGATTITNNGVVTGAINGIASNFGILTTPAATTIVQTRNATGGATGSGIVAGTGTGNINITSSAVASGGSGIFALSGSTGNVIVDGGNTGRATGSVLDGVVLNTASATAGRGLATVQNFGGGITGLRNGITVNFGTGGTLGDVLITNNGDITGTARNGIESYTTGATTITNNGVVTGAINGIASNFGIFTTPAATTIVQTRNVTGGATGSGIVAGSGAGSISITSTANTTGGAGIFAISGSGGNVVVDGGGTGVVRGSVTDGVQVATLGMAAVNNFATVTGQVNGIYVNGTGAGRATDIQGNGLVGGVTGTTNVGIAVGTFGGSSAGPINIGNMRTNGVITGAVDGIWANGTVGATAITVDRNVTGTTFDGILSTTTTGNQTINILAPAIVQGGRFGLDTGTTTGTATTNNTGTIQNRGDSVGAAGTAGLFSVGFLSGNNIVNNNAGGRIIGGFSTFGINNSLNNNSGGIWTPSLLNSFLGSNDQVNNAGLINARTGSTLLTGLERLNNNAGGVIDLTFGGTQATNSLVTTGNFAPGAGSTVRVAFNPTLANNAGGIGTDSASHARGASDTILAASVSPTARSTINLTTIGSVDSLIGTSGSVAVVQGAVALANPGLGASGTFVASSRYTLVGDPTTGAVKFNLTEASDGGAFLQWAPNITSATMGALAGGDLSGPNAAKGSAFGAARTGVSGAASVASSLADQGAAGAAGQCGTSGRRLNLFTTLQAGGSDYRGGGSGNSFGGALGLEGAIGNHGPDECGRTAIGIFGYGNTGKTRFSTGSSTADGYGVGGYIRTGNENGLYASLLGTGGAIDSKLTNNIFQSTSNTDALGLFVDATAGLVKPLGKKSKIDLRASVSYLSVATSAFTDSKGITVTSIDSKLWTAAASLGLVAPLGEKTNGFIRVGGKYSDLARKTNAYDIILSGSSNEFAGTAEAGLSAALSENTILGLAAYGDKSKSATNYGGRISLRVAF